MAGKETSMFLRYPLAVAFGTTMTLGLFWVMQSLIDSETTGIGEPRERMLLGFGRSVLERELHLPSLPSVVDDPEVPPIERLVDTDEGIDGIAVPRYEAITPGPQLLKLDNAAIGDGPLVSMVMNQPVYPPRALVLGLEGYTIVEFDVLADGRVANVVVIEASHELFKSASIRAAKKFRYKPRVVDGVAVPSARVRNLFRFELERT